MADDPRINVANIELTAAARQSFSVPPVILKPAEWEAKGIPHTRAEPAADVTQPEAGPAALALVPPPRPLGAEPAVSPLLLPMVRAGDSPAASTVLAGPSDTPDEPQARTPEPVVALGDSPATVSVTTTSPSDPTLPQHRPRLPASHRLQSPSWTTSRWPRRIL